MHLAVIVFSGVIAAINREMVLQRILQANGLKNVEQLEDNPELIISSADIIVEEIMRAKPFTGIEEALKIMVDRHYGIVISSCFVPEEAIKAWLRKYDLNKYVYLVYGLNDGTRNEHLESLARIEEPYDWLFIGNEPDDFVHIHEWGIRKVAVNATSNIYPKRIKVFYEPLSGELAEKITIGGG